MSRYDLHADTPRRRRRWPILVPLGVVVLAAAWSGFWFYAAGRAQDAFAAWRGREAARGRDISCSSQQAGGFPFRFELHCVDPTLGLRKARVTLKAKDVHAAAQIYQPNLMIAEIN